MVKNDEIEALKESLQRGGGVVARKTVGETLDPVLGEVHGRVATGGPCWCGDRERNHEGPERVLNVHRKGS